MNTYPLSYKLNKNNVKKFIKASDISVQDTLKKFISNTTYVSFEKFITRINANLKHIMNHLSTRRPLFIYIDTTGNNDYLHKSNYWLYTYIKNYLKKHIPDLELIFITNLEDEKLENNDTIMLIDDCIYSGSQMSSSISNMQPKSRSFNIIVFVCFMSKYGLEKIQKSYDKVFRRTSSNLILPDNIYYIEPINKFISSSDLDNLFSFYNIYDINDIPKYPVYFDHKLADNESSFPILYSGIVPNLKNKELLKQIKTLKINMFNPMYSKQVSKLRQDKKNAEDTLEIYPLLTNCEHIRNIDVMNPMCPFPPYKEGYSSFVRTLKRSSNKTSQTRTKSSTKKTV